MRMERPLPMDGQPARITELWAYTTVDPMTDVEGVLSAQMPGGGSMPLVTSMRSLADRLLPFAEAAVRSAEEPRPVLSLRHFIPDPEGDPVW